jgi:hypothetical protein
MTQKLINMGDHKTPQGIIMPGKRRRDGKYKLNLSETLRQTTGTHKTFKYVIVKVI